MFFSFNQFPHSKQNNNKYLENRPHTIQERLNNEIQQLVKDIWRVGDPEQPQVPFGVLFDDDDVQQHYEGLAATLKAAKKRERLCVIPIIILFNFFTSTMFHEVLTE